LLEKAMSVLTRALTLAQPEGYLRVFLDEGKLLINLLYQAKAHRIESGYLSKLLSEIRPKEAQAIPNVPLLAESLTRREFELLKLVESGLTNQEIAKKLVIALPTVKRHLSNIYTKLDVSNRTQAIAIGKELNLFE
jgi:LuxR family maltose regulon positive regulatory protein